MRLWGPGKKGTYLPKVKEDVSYPLPLRASDWEFTVKASYDSGLFDKFNELIEASKKQAITVQYIKERYLMSGVGFCYVPGDRLEFEGYVSTFGPWESTPQEQPTMSVTITPEET